MILGILRLAYNHPHSRLLICVIPLLLSYVLSGSSFFFSRVRYLHPPPQTEKSTNVVYYYTIVTVFPIKTPTKNAYADCNANAEKNNNQNVSKTKQNVEENEENDPLRISTPQITTAIFIRPPLTLGVAGGVKSCILLLRFDGVASTSNC